MFISSDENKKNIIWQDFKIKQKLPDGKIDKMKNNLIV